MTFMSPNRLVTQDVWLAFDYVKSIGQPPSNCFWMPVISRSDDFFVGLDQVAFLFEPIDARADL